MKGFFARMASRYFGRKVRMKYDAARDTHENRRHWENADGLSADSAANPQSRYKLRTRARYEAHESNSVLNGMVWTLANDTIGTGPRLQINTEDEDANSRIEKAFARWSREIGLAPKLRTMRVAKCVDGEALALFITNNRLRAPIKLDIKLIEADQMTSVVMPTDPTREVDGVIFDENGVTPSAQLINRD